MKRLFFFFIVFTLSLALPLCAGVFDPKTFTLSNGLRGIIIENHRAPVVTHMVWYKVGAIDDPQLKSGLAHFLEHLMFKGSPDSPAGKMMKEVERIGGEVNATTSQDYTYYYQTVPADQLETVMALEAGRMKNLEISNIYVEPEKNVVLEERRMRIENNPLGQFVEALGSTFYRHHPKRIPTIGWEHEIRTYTAEDAQAFYNTWYTPNNAILVVAGDIATGDVQKLAEKYYGSLPIKTHPVPLDIREPIHQPIQSHIKVTTPHIEEPFLARLYPAPTFKNDNGKYLYALEILEHILGQPKTGLLYRQFVEGRRLATFISVSRNAYTRGPTTFDVIAQPTPGTSLETLEKELFSFLENLKEKGISKDEIEKAKKRMLVTLAYTKDHVLSGATALAESVVVGASIEDVELWPERLKAVAPDLVNEAFKLIFNSRYSVTGYLIPEKTVDPIQKGS